ncbi:MAG: Uncharacterised protein [Pseudidiomarina mangrovi]|nr:MAG: Uncharacterised protein [Pseudidiomarina mangrovi]
MSSLIARELALQAWCEAQTGHRQERLEPVSGDASFRRYFRTSDGQRSLIAVDAPPPQEALQPFIAIAESYAEAGVNVPQVIAADEQQGFMLLTDLGSTLLLGELHEHSMSHWYQRALTDLAAVMSVTDTRLGQLPAYDEALLRRELSLFPDWLLQRHLGLQLSSAEQKLWQQFTEVMVNNALQQPQVGVHRDYHARNMMVIGPQQLAYIDFQDAVVGPITYDAVSLLRDCYVRWPQTQVQQLAEFLRQQLQQQRLLSTDVSAEQWQRWFDFMGLQRHSKAAGIFARLYHRDGKPGYLPDIPRTVSYLVDISAGYAELQPYHQWLQNKVLSALAQASDSEFSQ